MLQGCRTTFLILVIMLLPLHVLGQQHFAKEIPAGNYSGICPLGDDLYALVDDKAQDDGFRVVRLRIDQQQGRILQAEDSPPW